MANIDERLDRLTERHEALSQTVELLAAQIAQDAENIRALAGIAKNSTADMGRLTANIGKLTADIEELAGIAKNSLASIQSLENIATAHQDRLDGHERRLDDLEK